MTLLQINFQGLVLFCYVKIIAQLHCSALTNYIEPHERCNEHTMILNHFTRYYEGALLPEEGDELGAREKPTGRRRDYVPSAAPGSRLPHMNVRILSSPAAEVCIHKFCL